MVATEICGSSQRKNGTRKREVCSAESTPVEPMKITPSQVSRGNQYLRTDLSLVFNEAVSVWESFPFTTGEKTSWTKRWIGPERFRGRCYLFAASPPLFSIKIAAAATAGSTGPTQSNPAPTLA